MSFHMNVRVDRVFEEGSYRATLDTSSRRTPNSASA